jgi:transcriptional regulator
MHKLHNSNSDLHKPSPLATEQPRIESKFGPDTRSMLEPDTKIGRQERQAKVLTLHSKGYSQPEIANLLNINQSTVSRDLDDVRKRARNTLDLYIREEIPNEFQLYISGLNEITKSLWQIIEDKQNYITTRDRTYVLSLLMQCYTKRIEMLIGGPDSKLNATMHMRTIKSQEDQENDPLLQSLLKRH